MTEIHAWRFNAQLARVRPADTLVNELPPQKATSLSTSPTENTIRPRPRRSLASFATYLNTHRTVSSGKEPEWPTIDWSNLAETDKVYEPDLELMCSTLHKHVLTNPSQKLPASYNSFLMHLLEDYQQLKIERKELEMKLEAEIECRLADTEKYHRVITLWPSHSAVGLSDNRAMGSTLLAGEEDIKSLTKLGSYTGVAPLSKVDHSRSGKDRRNDGDTTVKARFKASKYRKFLSPSRRRSKTGARARRSQGPIPQLLQASSFRNIDDDTSSAESVFSSDGYEECSPSTPYDSAANGDPSMTLRPTNKLALHESQRPDEASSKIKVLSIRSSIPARTHTTTNNATEPRLATTFGDISRAAKPQSGAQASRNKDSLQQAAAASKRGHRRGFSFVPGDDSADPVLSKETPNRNNGFQERTTTPLASVEGDAKTSDRSHESLRTGSNSTLAVGSRPYQYLPEAFRSVSDLGESPKLSEHYGSGKSVLTAFKGSSSGSPSLSYRGSMSSIVDSGAVKENGKQRGNSHYAIAAARAAKNVSLDVKATQRQSAK